MNTIEMHDTDLRAAGTPEAEATLAARTEGAALVRLTLARMYGHTSAATSDGWAMVPHVTDRGTIGVVDVATGTAWDSGIEATPDVHALGLSDAHTPEGNHPSLAGDVIIDGELVQRMGETPGAGITAPAGWRRIDLPTWRGYYGDGSHYVPVPAELYEPEETWLRPTLRAVGLMTCYGTLGLPRRTLRDAAGHGASRPWTHPEFERLDPRWWPTDGETRWAIHRAACDRLDTIIDALIAAAGLDDEHAAVEAWRETGEDETAPGEMVYASAGPGRPYSERRVSRTIELLRERDSDHTYSARAALGMIVTPYADGVTTPALRDAGLIRMSDVATRENVRGARRVDIIGMLIERALLDRLGPVAEALAAAAGGLDPDRKTSAYEDVKTMLRPAAAHLAARLLEDAGATGLRSLLDGIPELYYRLAGAPVEMDVPAHQVS
jgi:hypothetical protein